MSKLKGILLAMLAVCAAFAWRVETPALANDSTRSEVMSLYDRFSEAQNRRDLEAVKAVLLDSPDFLWVSDGKSIWGRDALVERMGRFQSLEVWRVEPIRERARIVEVAPGIAYLHMPLDLHLGSKAAPTVTRFLVSVLCQQTAKGWRIAALFTTLDNP